MSASTLAIGQTVWWFDTNRRVYLRDENGCATGSPIYREHWRQTKIVSETPRSWITEWNHKIDKKTGQCRTVYGMVTFAYSLAEIDDKCWLHDHRYALSDHLRSCDDVALLRSIAAMVGYKEEA